MSGLQTNQSDKQSFVGGFGNPVFEAQTAFRAIMQAMAEPGLIVPLKTNLKPPAPLNPVAAAILCTLCDADTMLYQDAPKTDDQRVAAWVAFQTDAVLSTTPSLSNFALIASAQNLPTLDQFAQGTDEYPERSTTVIVQMDSLIDGPSLMLTGPGIRDKRIFQPADLPHHFPSSWMRNYAQFPRGVDIVFATANELACLPRSTKITRVL